jgi:AcrR family transcriptional regulator
MPRAKLRNEGLRADVLDAALRVLETDRAAVTARGVAGAAGTSTAAIYELFGDKGGLLRAVFYEAFRLLHDEIAAVPLTQDARRDLVSLMAATRRFAVRRPMLFEIMFARPFAEFAPTVEDADAASEVMRIVLRTVDRAERAGVIHGDRRDVAHVLVAVNRGLIAAELAGIAGSTGESVERRWTMGIDAVLDGLATKERS